ncbi:MAG: antitoxin VbhA family protein [Paludibacter sp.]|nr:antitoxin VbhA family protein [Paludibacter sp.]
MEKQTAWDYALGLIRIDGLTPTPEFLAMVEKEIQGKMTLREIESSLNRKYKMKGETVVGQLGQ